VSEVSLSRSATEGIGKALNQDVYGVETAERMAWLVLLLKSREDLPEWFPRGKWATIQHIESQLNAAVAEWILESQSDRSADHG
jgi:hypothetical protein